MEEEIVNKVAASGIKSIDLQDYYPKEAIAEFDFKNYLFMGLILKEKEFREALKNLDVEIYRNKLVAVYSSADAVIPMWAYMLVIAKLQSVAADIMVTTPENIKTVKTLKNIEAADPDIFKNQRVVVKGCGDLPIPPEIYAAITKKLMPVAKSIMFGEPCSTVPVYKNRNT